MTMSTLALSLSGAEGLSTSDTQELDANSSSRICCLTQHGKMIRV